ncbi:putative uncharacterized transposon-derived protein F52C9.6 [Stylophora pistillata]|uniref:Uncharacterized transposon-derived protein F52C9.6 n=1 Tax=Stylophora pistillata TaxID=50429 RepID=A0A2B4RAI4_STYPI|nr:putative uncharacterized transposon-derived protein F52C9.6 [Stylophora pistillata]
MEGSINEISGHIHQHAFKIQNDIDEKSRLFYKEWSSSPVWLPEGGTRLISTMPRGGLKLVKPNIIDSMSLDKLEQDLPKYTLKLQYSEKASANYYSRYEFISPQKEPLSVIADDDDAIAAPTEEDLPTILDAFNYAYTQLCLKINAKKTQVLFQPSPKDTVKTPPSIKIGETVLENVDNFTYLGSTLSPHANVDAEVNDRIQQAVAAFGKLQSRVFQDRDIRLDTKIQVYKAIVVTTLLYGSETWTIYRRHIAALEKFQQRCLRKMMTIKWQDRRTNLSVLEQATMCSVESVFVRNQLRWSGHVVRMENNRLPKQMFYSELTEGKQDVGGQKN